jgi:hypothetical protein
MTIRITLYVDLFADIPHLPCVGVQLFLVQCIAVRIWFLPYRVLEMIPFCSQTHVKSNKHFGVLIS